MEKHETETIDALRLEEDDAPAPSSRPPTLLIRMTRSSSR